MARNVMSALIQETLLGELSLTRRVRLHARIAEMLAEFYGPEAKAHALESAHLIATSLPPSAKYSEAIQSAVPLWPQGTQ